MKKDLENKLHEAACLARENSYSPYSKFKVGAASKWKDCDEIFSGCNVENASYPGCICAEQVSIVKAVSSSEKKPVLEKMLVVTASESGDFPCGVCLQVMSEFADKNTQVITSSPNKIIKTYAFSDLMPFSFNKENLP